MSDVRGRAALYVQNRPALAGMAMTSDAAGKRGPVDETGQPAGANLTPDLPPTTPWLRAARWLLLALVAASLLAVLASLALAPSYIPSRIDTYELGNDWPPVLIQSALADLGWPATTVAWFTYLRNLVFFLGMFMPGVLILRRKSQDWFGLYVAFALIVPPALTAIEPLADRVTGLAAVGNWAGAVSWQFYFILFYVFPDGRFVPRWTRWLIPIWIGLNLLPGAYGGDGPTGAFARFPILILVPFLLVFIAIGSQFYRYFWRSNATQRLQTKWVVFALVGTMLAAGWMGILNLRPALGSQALGTTLVLELGRLAVLNLVFVVVSIAIGVAILRYRLWDIDVLVRRTLIYSVLSGVLVLAYVGSVLVLGSVFRGLTGQGQNSLVVVLSTLTIAALFVPLRARVQAAIDRRFFRRKYDAAQTLAGFAMAARDEVDLDRLSTQLVDVVEHSMQPEQVSLWLRPANRPKGR